MNNNSVRFRNNRIRSVVVKLLNSAWWFTQVMPMVKKLTTYAAYDGQRFPS
jgi:hypothetical protein